MYINGGPLEKQRQLKSQPSLKIFTNNNNININQVLPGQLKSLWNPFPTIATTVLEEVIATSYSRFPNTRPTHAYQFFDFSNPQTALEPSVYQS